MPDTPSAAPEGADVVNDALYSLKRRAQNADDESIEQVDVVERHITQLTDALAAARQERERVEAERRTIGDWALELRDERDRLRAQLAERERDAARYVWLRGALWQRCPAGVLERLMNCGDEGLPYPSDPDGYKAHIDALVDAAMPHTLIESPRPTEGA